MNRTYKKLAKATKNTLPNVSFLSQQQKKNLTKSTSNILYPSKCGELAGSITETSTKAHSARLQQWRVAGNLRKSNRIGNRIQSPAPQGRKRLPFGHLNVEKNSRMKTGAEQCESRLSQRLWKRKILSELIEITISQYTYDD